MSGPQPVNAAEANFQGDADVARLKGGSDVVVWASATAGAPPYDVCFQRYEPGGTQLGANACINGAHEGAGGPFVKTRADGGFTILWSEYNDPNLAGLRWQDFDAAGNLQGGIQSGPLPVYVSAAPLAGGGYVGLLFASGGASMSLQLYAADGTAVGAPKPVGDSNGSGGRVVGLAGGGFAVAWLQGAPSTVVMTRAFSADGTPLGDAVAAAPNTMGPIMCVRNTDTVCPPWQNLAGMTATDDGAYIVAWLDGTGIAVAGDTFARQFRPDGSRASAVIGRIGERLVGPIAAAGPDAFVMAVSRPDSGGSGVGLLRIDATALR